MQLNGNKELYDFLMNLAQDLKGRGASELSELVAFASRQSAGMSTEFLGESRIALRRIVQEEKGALTASERADVEDVLQQLAVAIDRSPQSTG
jgi:hypothetical protein